MFSARTKGTANGFGRAQCHGAGELWALCGLGLSLAGRLGGPCVHSPELDPGQSPPELGEGRRMGRDRAGGDIPILSTPELVLGGCQSIPSTPQNHQHGVWVLQTQPREPGRGRLCVLGGSSHPGAPPRSPLTAWAHGMSLCSHISEKRKMKSSPVIIY